MPRISDNVVARLGFLEVVSTGKRPMTKSSEMKTESRAIYKYKYSSCSSGNTLKQKSGSFVDKKTGRTGYKQETAYTKSLKVDNKVNGSSTEFQTQVKFKQVYTPGPASVKSSKAPNSNNCKSTVAPKSNNPKSSVAPKSNNYKSSGSKSGSKNKAGTSFSHVLSSFSGFSRF